jgi:hypothetical protein
MQKEKEIDIIFWAEKIDHRNPANTPEVERIKQKVLNS